MFSIYGPKGPIFYGPFESLSSIPPVAGSTAVQAVRKVKFDDEQSIGEKTLPPLTSPATRAYHAMQMEELERGPLYVAEQIMQRKIITLKDEDTVDKALQTLIGHQIHQAPVLDAADCLCGIISDRNLLRALYTNHQQLDATLRRKVAEVMTTPVIAAAPKTDIRRIAQAMLEHGVEGIPIVNETGQLIGFISRTDILGAVVTDPPLRTWR